MTLKKALDLWNEHQPEPDASGLPDVIQERLPQAAAHANAAAAKGNAVDASRVNALIDVAARSKTSGKRVYWLQKAAQALADIYSPHAACSAGCAHCCHIPVKITQAEAIYLGRVLGRAPMPTGALPPEPVILGYESPCPFLVDNQCSVYEHRPAVCRSHLNLDRDDLLCRLQAGMNVPVPYLDTRPLVAGAFFVLGEKQPLADIRQWFPQELFG